MSKIVIGIPCYQDVSAETLIDYMRFTYYVGRHSEHECYLDVVTKRDQWRARNSIVEAAIQVNADYLFFMDDDHVINWEESFTTHNRYGLLDTLLSHIQEGEKRGIVGALYYHRGETVPPC